MLGPNNFPLTGSMDENLRLLDRMSQTRVLQMVSANWWGWVAPRLRDEGSWGVGRSEF